MVLREVLAEAADGSVLVGLGLKFSPLLIKKHVPISTESDRRL
jgi:hypothetical protein